ncbi:hypothetical protein ACQKWADRAFT_187267 [Trichoderma austrokoningii]
MKMRIKMEVMSQPVDVLPAAPPSCPASLSRCTMTRWLQMSMNISNFSIILSFSTSLALSSSISFCFSSSTFLRSSRALASSRRRSDRIRSSGDGCGLVYMAGLFSARPVATFCGLRLMAARAL